MSDFEARPGPIGSATPPAGSPAGSARSLPDPAAAEADLIRRARALRQQPLHEHPDVYDEIHAELQRSLSTIDSR